jgi:O-antigen/teichoic acid export membrane protein
MTNKEQQIKNSFIYLLPMVIGCILPFITLPIFTRILTTEDYGVLALAQAYAIFVNGLANFGMTAAYERDYFQYRGNHLKMAQLLFSVLLFVMLNFLLLAGLTYVFRGVLAEIIIGSVEYGNILFWAFCGQFFSSIISYYLTYFKNSEKATSFAGYTMAAAFINLAVSLLLVAYFRIGVIGIVYAQVCSGAVVFCILSYKFTASMPLSLSRSIFNKSLRIAYPLTPRIFFGVIGTQFNKYMIGLLATVGGVGIYSIGQRLSYIVFYFMTAIGNVFSPQVYKRMFDLKERGGKAIGTYITPFCYISVFLALLVALFSEEVISILTPLSFHGATDIVTILSLYYGFLFFGMLNGPQLIFKKKTHITSLLTVVSIGLNIGLSIPFILKWGAIGAAWAMLLSGLLSGMISFIVAQHYYKIYWEYSKIGAIFVIFFVCSILVILLRNFATPYEIRLIVKSLSIIFYFYLGITFKIITVENYTLVKNLFLLRTRNNMLFTE